AGDNSRDFFVSQPAKQTAQFRAQNRWTGQAGENGFDGVEDNSFRADRIDGVTQANEQALEVVFSGLFDFAALDMNVVDNQFLAVGKFLEVVSQRGDILTQIFFSLLEGHKNARLVKLRNAVNKKLNGQESLTAAGAAAHQRRADLRSEE